MAMSANAEGSSAASDHQTRADAVRLAAGRAQPGPQARLIQSLAQALQRLEAGGLHLQGHIAALRAEFQLMHTQLLTQQRRPGLAQQTEQPLIPALAAARQVLIELLAQVDEPAVFREQGLVEVRIVPGQ